MTASTDDLRPGDQADDPTTDESARARIGDQLEATLFVEAGAGTGKTTALVGRIVELVATGRAALRNIAAITFTEAAAGELRDRIRLDLELVAAGADPTRAERAAAALAEIDAAAISTLHGFAHRILAEHPFEAGLPPTFEVFDEIRSAVAFDERWQAFLDELLDDEDARPVLQRALVAKVRLDQLRSIARELNRNWDLVIDHPPRSVAQPTVSTDALRQALAEAQAVAGVCCDPSDRLYVHIEQLEGFVQRLATTASELEALELLAGAPKLASGHGRKPNWDGHVDEVRDALARAEAIKERILQQVVQAALSELIVGLGRLTLEAADSRRRDGGLEFHDLLVQARALVRTHPEVVATLHDTYTHLLIDEFQDTDPIQLELAVRIATAGEHPPDDADGADGADYPGDWRGWSLPPGRLFFVGDPKQSIYRFRRADVGVFLAARQAYVDEPEQLTRNHRSVPGIVSWVNEVFAELIGNGSEGSQPAYAPLTPHREPPGGDAGREIGRGAGAVGQEAPPVVLLGQAHDALMPDVRTAEAADVAAAIGRVRDERWAVGDEGRPARLADVCVLIPTRAALPSLERALDRAQLPYRVESSSLVYASPEVRDLLSVLRAVDDPTDEISVMATLRSPWFGCGDDDLLEFRLAGGQWDPRPDPPEGLDDEHPVVAGLRSLRSLHDRRWWHDASGLIELVLAERRAFELGLDEQRPRDVWRRLRFVVDQARAFTDAYGADLRRYLAWADLQSADDARVVETVLPETDDDAVRIMTIHASKGLEFPVVVLAGLNTEDRGVSGVDVLWGPSGPEVKLVKALATAGYAELAGVEAARQADEQIRLLYVAATRARDHLFVSLHRKAGTRSHAERLASLCDAIPGLWPQLPPAAPAPGHARSPAEPGLIGEDLMAPDPRGAHPVGARPDGPDLIDADHGARPLGAGSIETERAAWIEQRAERMRRALDPRTVAATGVSHLVARHEPEAALDRSGDAAVDELGTTPGDIDAADDERAPWRRGRAGTAVGRAVHAVLQVVDLATGEGLAEMARAQAVAEGVPDRHRQVERLARGALGSEVVRGAVAGGRFWRELYVGVPVGDRVLEGFVDLLVEGPGGLIVVDYKTDAAPDHDLDATVERYRLQGAAYALALEQSLERPVEACVFLFLRPDGAVERRLPDLGSATREVARLLTST